MAVIARVPTNTRFGHDVSVFTLDGATDLLNLTDVGVTMPAETRDAASMMDTFTLNERVVAGMELNWGRSPEGTLPLLGLALDTSEFLGVVRHSRSGRIIAPTSKFLITEAEWSADKGPQKETGKAVLYGSPGTPANTGTGPARTSRANANLLAVPFGDKVVRVMLDLADFVSVFKSAKIRVTTKTADGAEAVNDRWRLPVGLNQTVIVTLEKIVQDELEFLMKSIADAPVDVLVECIEGGTGVTFEGSFSIQQNDWKAENAGQGESIELINRGAVSVS